MGAEKIHIGVCDVFFTPPGTTNEQYIGLTKGGVEFTYEPKFHEVKVDQYGDTPIDYTLEGESCKAKVPIVETDLQKIADLMPTGTADTVNGALKHVSFGSFPGQKLQDRAGKLRLHPIAMGSDRSNDIVIWKACNTGTLNLKFMFNDEQVIEANFIGLVDNTKGRGQMLFAIGDSSTTPVGTKLLTDVFIIPGTSSVQISKTTAFAIKGIYEGGLEEIITGATWTSSAASVATINSSGTATGVAAGTSIITATYSSAGSSFTATAVLTVTA